MSGVTITGRIERRTAGRRPEKASSPPPASEPTSKPQVAGPSRLARMLALAYYVERLIEDGRLRDYAHAASLLGITRPRMTQVMNLLYLSTEVQEAALLGRTNVSEHCLRIKSARSESAAAK